MSDPATPNSSKIFLSLQKPTRCPYSCQAQFGRSGTAFFAPPGGFTMVRGMGWSIAQCSTLTQGQTTILAPSGKGRGGRSVIGE